MSYPTEDAHSRRPLKRGDTIEFWAPFGESLIRFKVDGHQYICNSKEFEEYTTEKV